MLARGTGRRRHAVAGLVAAALASVLTACSGDDDTQAQPSPTAAKRPYQARQIAKSAI